MKLTAPKTSQSSRLEEAFYAELKLFGLPLPERQFLFHPARKWRADFCWPDKRIIVEIDGGLYVSGRHNRGAAMEADFFKINEAVRLGWKVFKFGPAALRGKKRTLQASPALEFMEKILRQEAA